MLAMHWLNDEEVYKILADLVVSKKLSREVDNYRTPSQAARAAMQLMNADRHVAAGKRVKFLLTHGGAGVSAWGLPDSLDPRRIDTKAYMKLITRARSTVLDYLVSVEELQMGVRSFESSQPMRLF